MMTLQEFANWIIPNVYVSIQLYIQNSRVRERFEVEVDHSPCGKHWQIYIRCRCGEVVSIVVDGREVELVRVSSEQFVWLDPIAHGLYDEVVANCRCWERLVSMRINFRPAIEDGHPVFRGEGAFIGDEAFIDPLENLNSICPNPICKKKVKKKKEILPTVRLIR